MPLQSNCTDCVGRSLFVLPYYGYGWARQDDSAPPKTPLDSLGPESFDIHADELVNCDEQIMGVNGTIESPGHELNGCWCCCLLRNPDECNFTDCPGHYMVWIANKKLPIQPVPYPKEALFNWVKFEKHEFCLGGFGAVVESVESVQGLYETAMAARRQVANQ